MAGGWHDAGDLSQGLINTGEITYSMFALAERLRERGDDPALVARLIEEARWGLDWVLRVRFPADSGWGSPATTSGRTTLSATPTTARPSQRTILTRTTSRPRPRQRRTAC
jgi:hypothetical protein